MADIFDASGVAGGQSDGLGNLASIFSGVVSKLEQAAGGLAESAKTLVDASARLAGVAGVSPVQGPAGDMRKNDLLDEAFSIVPMTPSVPTAQPLPAQASRALPAPTAEVTPFAGMFAPLQKAADKLAAAAEHLTKVGGGSSGPTLPLARRVPTTTGPQVNPIGGLARIGQQGLGRIAASIPGLSSLAPAIGPALGALGALGTALGAAAGVAAIFTAAVVGAAAAVVGAIFVARHFVEAFDPSTVLAFDSILQDLTAVVGSVLTPVVSEATRVIHAFASSLYSAASNVLPAVRVAAKAFADVLLTAMPIVSAWAGYVGAVAPLFADLARSMADYLMPAVRGLATAMVGWVEVIKAVLKSVLVPLAAIFGNTKSLGQAFGMLVVVLSAVIFRLLGMAGATDAMIASLQDGGGKRDAMGLAAAKNARLTGIETLGRETLQRAFTTSGRAGQEGGDVDDQQFRNELAAMAKKIQGTDLATTITAAIRAAIGIPTPQQALGKAKNALENFPGHAVFAPGNFAARLLGLPEIM